MIDHFSRHLLARFLVSGREVARLRRRHRPLPVRPGRRHDAAADPESARLAPAVGQPGGPSRGGGGSAPSLGHCEAAEPPRRPRRRARGRRLVDAAGLHAPLRTERGAAGVHLRAFGAFRDLGYSAERWARSSLRSRPSQPHPCLPVVSRGGSDRGLRSSGAAPDRRRGHWRLRGRSRVAIQRPAPRLVGRRLLHLPPRELPTARPRCGRSGWTTETGGKSPAAEPRRRRNRRMGSLST